MARSACLSVRPVVCHTPSNTKYDKEAWDGQIQVGKENMGDDNDAGIDNLSEM